MDERDDSRYITLTIERGGRHYDVSRKYPHGENRYPGIPTHARSGAPKADRTRSGAVAMAADVGLVCDGGGMGVVREINS